MKGTITIECTNGNNLTDKNLTFKNDAPFIICISKINNTLIDNAEVRYYNVRMLEYEGIIIIIEMK